MIVACLKWVSHPSEPDDERFAGMSPADRAALEMALQQAASMGDTVTAITVGPAGADSVLREAHATGARRLVRIDTAEESLALLGSDVVVVDDGGDLVRRWELKFVWFNPLWALLTVALGCLALMAFRLRWAARVAGAGFAVLALVIFAMQSFDYVRDDGVLQSVGTSANAAVWAAFALALLVADRAARHGCAVAPETA